MSQTDTRVGAFRVLAGEDLTDKEGRLVKLTQDAGVPEVKLPASNDDYALYVLLDGAAAVPPVAVPPVAVPKPLHNREAAKPAVAEKGAAGGGDRAAKIRNRAQEIARRDGTSFTVAFRAAEQELGEVR